MNTLETLYLFCTLGSTFWKMGNLEGINPVRTTCGCHSTLLRKKKNLQTDRTDQVEDTERRERERRTHQFQPRSQNTGTATFGTTELEERNMTAKYRFQAHRVRPALFGSAGGKLTQPRNNIRSMGQCCSTKSMSKITEQHPPYPVKQCRGRRRRRPPYARE